MKILSLILMSISLNALAERFSVPDQDDWNRHSYSHTQDTTSQKNGQTYNLDKTTTYNGNGTKSNTTTLTDQNNNKSYTEQGSTSNAYGNNSRHETQTETLTNNQNHHSYTYQGQKQKHYTHENTYSHQTGTVTNNQTGKSYNLNSTEINHNSTATNQVVVPANSNTVVIEQQSQAVYYPSYYSSMAMTPMMMGVPISGAMNNSNNLNISPANNPNTVQKPESGSYESALNNYMH